MNTLNNSINPNKFYKLSRGVLMHLHEILNPSEMLIYLFLKTENPFSDRFKQISTKEISNILNIGVRTIQKAIKKFRELKLINYNTLDFEYKTTKIEDEIKFAETKNNSPERQNIRQDEIKFAEAKNNSPPTAKTIAVQESCKPKTIKTIKTPQTSSDSIMNENTKVAKEKEGDCNKEEILTTKKETTDPIINTKELKPEPLINSKEEKNKIPEVKKQQTQAITKNEEETIKIPETKNQEIETVTKSEEEGIEIPQTENQEIEAVKSKEEKIHIPKAESLKTKTVNREEKQKIEIPKAENFKTETVISESKEPINRSLSEEIKEAINQQIKEAINQRLDEAKANKDNTQVNPTNTNISSDCRTLSDKTGNLTEDVNIYSEEKSSSVVRCPLSFEECDQEFLEWKAQDWANHFKYPIEKGRRNLKAHLKKSPEKIADYWQEWQGVKAHLKRKEEMLIEVDGEWISINEYKQREAKKEQLVANSPVSPMAEELVNKFRAVMK